MSLAYRSFWMLFSSLGTTQWESQKICLCLALTLGGAFWMAMPHLLSSCLGSCLLLFCFVNSLPLLSHQPLVILSMQHAQTKLSFILLPPYFGLFVVDTRSQGAKTGLKLCSQIHKWSLTFWSYLLPEIAVAGIHQHARFRWHWKSNPEACAC